MQTVHCLTVPVKIRQDKEAFLAMLSVHDILLFCPTFYDVEDPIQPTFLAIPPHVWTNVLSEDLWCLGHHTNTLRGVFLDVLFRAWINEVELQVGWLLWDIISISGAR
jgi:hypothetical protein